MAAAGTASSCRERVPLGAAGLEEGLGCLGPQTGPAAGWRRLPLTLRTADAGPLLASIEIGDVERRPARREVVPQQQQRGYSLCRHHERAAKTFLSAVGTDFRSAFSHWLVHARKAMSSPSRAAFDSSGDMTPMTVRSSSTGMPTASPARWASLSRSATLKATNRPVWSSSSASHHAQR